MATPGTHRLGPQKPIELVSGNQPAQKRVTAEIRWENEAVFSEPRVPTTAGCTQLGPGEEALGDGLQKPVPKSLQVQADAAVEGK